MGCGYMNVRSTSTLKYLFDDPTAALHEQNGTDHLKAVSVGQPDGLLALPGQSSPAHANTQAECRDGWRGLGWW